MSQVAVIGTTSWGNTLGLVFAGKGLAVRMWARTEAEAVRLREQELTGNPSGAALSPQISVTSRLSEALADATAVILAVPSQRMRQNIGLVRDYLDRSMLLVSAAKGLELDSHRRMSQVIAEEVPPDCQANICVLSGPNLSREVRRGLPAAAVVAAEDQAVAERAQKLLSTEKFCLYTSTDIVGVELGGALKNIVALGAGIVDGLGFGDNTKSAFITRGLIEVAALGVALGAHPLTFTGLAGLGDTIATCASPLSRNHYVGVELAKGRSLKEIIASMTGVAEGVNTAIGAHSLAQEYGLGMPVLEKIYQVLFEGADPLSVVAEITSSEASHELAGQNWDFSSFSRTESAN